MSWINWVVFAGILLITELFTGSFFMLMIALGFMAGALASLLGAGLTTQVIVTALTAAIATLCLQKYRSRKKTQHPDTTINLDLGQSITITMWEKPRKTRAFYRGSWWDVELSDTEEKSPEAGEFIIQQIKGNCLLVESVKRD